MTIPTVNRTDMWTRYPAATFFSDPTAGLSYFSHFNTFLPSATAGQGEWNTAAATSGTAAVIAGDAGVLQLAAGAATANQGITMLQPADVILLNNGTARKRFLMEARVKFTSPTTCQFFFGLSTRDTTLIASGANTSDNHFGFEMSAASQSANAGKLQLVSEKATVRTTKANILTPAAGTWVTLGLEYDPNGYIIPWVNGERVETHIITTNVPDTENLAIHIVCQANGTTEPKVDLDWLQFACFQ
jgi:hypothetical protein